jgi:ribonuclease BN (tRNA processing enzyme)
LIKLAQNADVFISEVASPPSNPGNRPVGAASARHMEEDHVNPTQVADMAAKAGVKSIVLTHILGAPGRNGENLTNPMAEKFKGAIHVSKDLDEITAP